MELHKTITRLLTFKISKDEMLSFNKKHFLAGLVGTWIVGMGRYWDDSGANLLQHLGLGSVLYIFVLAAFLWLIILPFKIPHWSYFTILTFISLTSFPAIFYAIPVEKYFSIKIANQMNVWFLAIVASWRLGLLYYFLKVFTQLRKSHILIITFMPMCLIIASLTVLNLHRVVFNVMGGLRTETAHDSEYGVLFFLTTISVLLAIPLLLAYLVAIHKSRLNKKI